MKKTNTGTEHIPSVFPAIIAFTVTGITVGNIYANISSDLNGREVNRLKASLAGAAIGAPVGTALGFSIQKDARFKSRFKPKPRKPIKRVNRPPGSHRTLIKLLPAIFLGAIGYMAGNHRPFYSELKPYESTSSKKGAALGSVIGGGLGYWLGNTISGRMQNQATATSDSLLTKSK